MKTVYKNRIYAVLSFAYAIQALPEFFDLSLDHEDMAGILQFLTYCPTVFNAPLMNSRNHLNESAEE